MVDGMKAPQSQGLQRAAVDDRRHRNAYLLPWWQPDTHLVAVLLGAQCVGAVQHQSQPGDGRPVPRVRDGHRLQDPAISEVVISRTGVRAALIADGKVYVAVVERRPDGKYALTSPLPVALGLSSRAVSLSWVTGDTIMVAREGNVDPVFTVSIDGSQFSAVTSQNLTPPVRVVTAAPATQYVADSRAVLQLQTADPTRNDRFWREVPGLTGEQVVPVLPS